MRIVQANAVYDPTVRTPAALLDRYHTLTEWTSAVVAAGAEVAVVQRFNSDARLDRDGGSYRFVKDSQVPWLSTSLAPREFVSAIAAESPDVVHVNGLIFPGLVAGIRAAVPPRTAIVAQHHGGQFPVRGPGLVGMWRRRQWRAGLAAADAVSFTSAEQALPWKQAGVLGGQRVLEIVEAGTSLRTIDRDRARAAIDAGGDPLMLWVGRLTTNKDPLTVLEGLELALPAMPDARVVMVFGDDTLLSDVEARVRGSSLLRAAVTLVGRMPRDEMPNYYSAADLFISGSHYEGSGYALIEAMSAGLLPVVTDIPSFRSIAGDCGERWKAGDPQALAAALARACAEGVQHRRALVAAQYDRVLRWDAIARTTLAAYQSLVDARRPQHA